MQALDLDHRAPTGFVREVVGFRHDTVDAACTKVEPISRDLRIARRRGDRQSAVAGGDDGFEAGAPLAERAGTQVRVAVGEEVEGDVASRPVAAQPLDPRLSGMKPAHEDREIGEAGHAPHLLVRGDGEAADREGEDQAEVQVGAHAQEPTTATRAPYSPSPLWGEGRVRGESR